jgi:hypothetical protein
VEVNGGAHIMGPGASWDNFSLVSSAKREGTGSEVEVNGGAHIMGPGASWDSFC